MPQVIESYVKDGKLDLLTDTRSGDITDEQIEQIISLIKGSLPLDFTDYKRPTIIRRITRRMVEQNFSRFDKYFDLLKNNTQEINLLANDFLISVTTFFRDTEAFKIIEDVVIPNMIKKNSGDVLKVWVAGCATGEEAYSLAILIKEYLIRHPKNLEVKIFATDISKAALDQASKGIYGENVEKNVSKERLKKFFTRENKTYTIKHEIRKMLIFAQHDLVKNPPYCNVDLISCRNVLIYLNVTLQRKVLSMLHFGLKKDGYLFLGPSENAALLKTDLDEISGKWNISKSNKTGRAIQFDSFASHVIDGLKTTHMGVSKKQPDPISASIVNDKINLAVLKESGFSGVCIDENLTVISSFGQVNTYLKNQILNFNLNDLLPESIAIPFKAAAHKALKLNERVVIHDLLLETETGLNTRKINIIISPIHSKDQNNTYLVLFADSKTKTRRARYQVTHENISDITKEYLINLEEEVAGLKHALVIANKRIASSDENMQSFNEELQSANEEMQSANEEMQSSNEELQSVNEELQTINKAHQFTITELTDLNDDLNNYFRSNTNGQLFVDRDLLLKRYSPGAVRHINIRERDIGRPLSNITTNIKFETFIDDVKNVILNEETITREAESVDGRVYQVMTMPYLKKNSKKADGAIISFYDVTELKDLLKELNISNASLRRINDDLNNFVYGASHDLNAPILNIETVLGLLNQKMDMANPDIVNLSGMINYAIGNFKEVISDMGKIGALDAEMINEGDIEDFEVVFKGIREAISEKILLTKAKIITDFQENRIRFPKKYLRSILLNLITNAIKFSSPERLPVIELRTVKTDGFILLTVKDNGIGILQERIDFIFKVYQRLNESMEGQGIGLFLVQKIINASGGKIEVESEINKGSTFKIFFKI